LLFRITPADAPRAYLSSPVMGLNKLRGALSHTFNEMNSSANNSISLAYMNELTSFNGYQKAQN
jgi:hypothetical protein